MSALGSLETLNFDFTKIKAFYMYKNAWSKNLNGYPSFCNCFLVSFPTSHKIIVIS